MLLYFTSLKRFVQLFWCFFSIFTCNYHLNILIFYSITLNVFILLYFIVGVLFGWDKIKAALLRYEEINGDFFVPWKFTIPSHAESSGWPPGMYLRTHVRTCEWTYGCTDVHTCVLKYFIVLKKVFEFCCCSNIILL